jgi:hypothetical protein
MAAASTSSPRLPEWISLARIALAVLIPTVSLFTLGYIVLERLVRRRPITIWKLLLPLNIFAAMFSIALLIGWR